MTRWLARGTIFFAILPLPVGGFLLWPADRSAVRQGTVAVASVGPGIDVGAVDSAAKVALRVAPFRPDGKPSRLRYELTESGMQVDPGAIPRPSLELTGIFGGHAPLAVLGGVPGHDGAVLMGVGDTAGGLQVRRIKEGSVTVTGMDTTWVLRVRGPQ